MTLMQRVKRGFQRELISVRQYPKTYLTVGIALGLLVAIGTVLLW